MKRNKIILFGAGKIGAEALDFFGSCNVWYFADNAKAGNMHKGKYVLSMDELREIHCDCNVIVSVKESYQTEIGKQLEKAGIPFAFYRDFQKEYADTNGGNLRIAKLKNAFYGQKCFLIGNGPSLKTEDLEKLKENNIVSMGCNFINKIFDQTDWRPELYCAGEPSVIMLNLDFIRDYHAKAKFVYGLYSNPKEREELENMRFPEDVCFYGSQHSDSELLFSEDVSKVVHNGWSVMFHMIQIAVYLGFVELYLLGVDNTQYSTVHCDKFVCEGQHFYKEDANELEKRREILKDWKAYDDESLYIRRLEREYGFAREYAEARGIKIYNATRGGKLEVFERVDFDSLFRKGEAN